ncbi:hypothetical protein HanIR_Chr04g0189581 [Helianthus annuus]|nr:hypothetical protein HanIR_Chr04g0189581 [Helianthus annuus]
MVLSMSFESYHNFIWKSLSNIPSKVNGSMFSPLWMSTPKSHNFLKLLHILI